MDPPQTTTTRLAAFLAAPAVTSLCVYFVRLNKKAAGPRQSPRILLPSELSTLDARFRTISQLVLGRELPRESRGWPGHCWGVAL